MNLFFSVKSKYATIYIFTLYWTICLFKTRLFVNLRYSGYQTVHVTIIFEFSFILIFLYIFSAKSHLVGAFLCCLCNIVNFVIQTIVVFEKFHCSFKYCSQYTLCYTFTYIGASNCCII